MKRTTASECIGYTDFTYFKGLSVDRCTAESHYSSEIQDEQQTSLRNREEAGGKSLIKTALLKYELPSGVVEISAASPFVNDQL